MDVKKVPSSSIKEGNTRRCGMRRLVISLDYMCFFPSKVKSEIGMNGLKLSRFRSIDRHIGHPSYGSDLIGVDLTVHPGV